MVIISLKQPNTDTIVTLKQMLNYIIVQQRERRI